MSKSPYPSQDAVRLARIVQGALADNPDGFTLVPDSVKSDLTLTMLSPESFPDISGYAVGGIIRGLKIPPQSARSTVPQDRKIARWLDKYLSVRSALPIPVYVGGWWDGDTNTVYLDAVVLVSSRERALALARVWGELAVGVFNRGEYVETVYV